VLVGVMLPGLFGMMSSVNGVSMRHMGVVPGLLMIARLVMLGRFSMVFGSLFVMLRSFMVMLRSFVSHGVYRRNLRIQ
jgi:hypothetical protein